MKAFTLLPLLAFALQAVAGPIPETESSTTSELVQRASSTTVKVKVGVCVDSYHEGLCLALDVERGKCKDMNHPLFRNKASSAKAQEGATCYLYTDSGCKGQKFKLAGGGVGIENFKKVGYNDDVESLRCH